MTPDARRIVRVVIGFWLVGWYCNAPGRGFLRNFIDALSYSIDYPVVPAVLQDARVALANYLAPSLALAALAWPHPKLARPVAVLMTATALLACLHLETANDATFLTSFWVGLWLVWFVWRAERDDAAHYALARGLAHAVVGLLFLGGLVGKLTPEYRSGEAFYRIYFRDNPSWPYPTLRARLDPETFRALATWFSRSAISAETMMSLAPILPTRVVLVVGAGTMLMMMYAWTFHLFSVLSSVLGLLVAAELMRRAEDRAPRRRKKARK